MRPVLVYRDRRDAGEILAAHMMERLGAVTDAVVLAVPRGGVPVGRAVAHAFHAPLDLLVVVKIPIPQHEHLALGAIAEGCCQVLDDAMITAFQINPFMLDAVADRKVGELRRREQRYRETHPPACIEGKTALIIDDGIHSGFTMRAAIAAVRERRPKQIIVGAPVGATTSCRQLTGEVDTLICPLQTDPFGELGAWYVNFAPVSDEEICETLRSTALSEANGPERPGVLSR